MTRDDAVHKASVVPFSSHGALKFGSVCSGIEAASVAWEPLGFRPVFFSEVDAFPSAVLAARWPHVPNHGDMTKFEEWGYGEGSIDVLVGGTPCQSFSVAGLRGGLDDDRGNLALVYARILERLRPRFFVWENVPGVLSSNGGRDFGAILGAFQELGYGWAYRVLDAQYFGVPQRRRRVFVVGCLGDWRAAAAVLFERESLLGNPKKGDKTGKEASGGTRNSPENRVWPKRVTSTLDCAYGTKQGQNNQHVFSGAGLFVPSVANCLTSSPASNQSPNVASGQTVALGSTSRQGADDVALPEIDGGHVFPTKVIGGIDGEHNSYGPTGPTGPTGPLLKGSPSGVRRLTPRECERLQGFPDDHTMISYRGKPSPDGPRYKAIGNSMAVPVMAWIGQRIKEVSAKL